MENVRDRLLDEGQALIQSFGYNGFSFRDVATKVGIRSASIHYHFPTKSDLGAAVARRYTADFMEKLETKEATEGDTATLLVYYASLFKGALQQDNKMCLCGMLGAEATSLPDAVKVEVSQFFDKNVTWLAGVFVRHDEDADSKALSGAEKKAAAFIATLEGALILAKGMDRPEIFDQVVDVTLAASGGIS